MVNTDIINTYLGSSQVDKIMLGGEQVYPTAEPNPCAGYSSQEECDCVMNGGTWSGGSCLENPSPEPDE